jgi:hypothetical protein
MRISPSVDLVFTHSNIGARTHLGRRIAPRRVPDHNEHLTTSGPERVVAADPERALAAPTVSSSITRERARTKHRRASNRTHER